MTAIYTPNDVQTTAIISAAGEKGITIAGGLHKEIKSKYFRIGHMGLTAVERRSEDLDKLLAALKYAVQSSQL